MKSIKILLVVLACFSLSYALAQEKQPSEISYKVDFGPVYPIEGRSDLITGKIAFNDETNAIEKVSFDVPLNTFAGTNSGYLEWIGNSWYYPDMKFASGRITKVGEDQYKIQGNLEFRRKIGFVEIDMTRKDLDNQIILEGNFDMYTKDYFTFHVPLELVPNIISFKIQLVFDKPAENS